MIDTQPATTTSAPRPGPRPWVATPVRWAATIAGWARALLRWVNAADWRFHTAVIGGFLLLATYVMVRVWVAPGGRLLENGADQMFFQYMFAHGERVAFHGEYPFVTERLNVPHGVNL